MTGENEEVIMAMRTLHSEDDVEREIAKLQQYFKERKRSYQSKPGDIYIPYQAGCADAMLIALRTIRDIDRYYRRRVKYLTVEVEGLRRRNKKLFNRFAELDDALIKSHIPSIQIVEILGDDSGIAGIEPTEPFVIHARKNAGWSEWAWHINK